VLVASAGVHTFMYRQSSDCCVNHRPPALWKQSAVVSLVASRTAGDQLAGGCGLAQRRDPTGGAECGIPKKERCEGDVTRPRTSPYCVGMTTVSS